jgi:NAD(P)-dependent dehydrogenase (short-subunit alcohol dehydrogenase family)
MHARLHIHLKNKVAIITGARRGVGEAIARSSVAARKIKALQAVADSLGEPQYGPSGD